MVAAEALTHDAILADHLTRWFADTWPLIRAERRVLAVGGSLDPDPVAVVMTNPWGLGATRAIVEARPARDAVAVTELEFRYWSRQHPDEAHRHHVNHWSWVKRGLPPQRQAEFAWLGAANDAVLWLHRSGTAGAGRCDGLRCAVYSWDGHVGHLLCADARRDASGAGDGAAV
ncbi:MAG: hypothetical protein ACKOCW_14145 [Planctomycetaceae bacterium]